MARTPTRTAKSTKPFALRGQDWWDRLHKLRDPLTPTQKRGLQAAFSGGRTLQADWKRISEMAEYVALRHVTDATQTKVFVGKGSARYVRKQLTGAMAAADAATKALNTVVEHWGSLAGAPGQVKAMVELRNWADTVISRLADEREAMKRRRTSLPVPVKRGNPDDPETYRLRVLASYFRHHEWPVSSSMTGEFALACAVITSTPLNPTRLKRIVASRYPYTALLAGAPPFKPTAPRTITFPVSQ
jgi:hypothetical protein